MKFRSLIKSREKLACIEIYCPGCERIHSIPVGPNNDPRWNLNKLPGQTDKTASLNDMEKITLDPSILFPKSETQLRCHAYIRVGKWYYFEDCDHKYAGKIIPMVNLPE